MTYQLDPVKCREIIASARWRVVPSDDCIVWTGRTTADGYGEVHYATEGGTKKIRALVHRVALAAHLGRDIAPGMQVGHICHDNTPDCVGYCQHRACVNPAHLAEQTPRQNSLSSNHPGVRAHLAGTCMAGHPRNGRKSCYECQARADAERRQRVKEAASLLGYSTTADYVAEYGCGVIAARAVLALDPTHRRAGGPSPLDNVSAAVGGSCTSPTH